MSFKTVVLDGEAYELLRRQEPPVESFSDAVKLLARPRHAVAAFGGMWSDTTA
jgi:hypothetical protein